jgi:hypothetical protein
MSLVYKRSYLIIHICIGILIIGFEYLYRRIIQTYEIYIRTCPDVFYIEFKQLNNIQTSNWLENKINNLVETFYSINNQCITKELKLNLNSMFLFLRYLWLSISGIYLCFALKCVMEQRKYSTWMT